MSAVRPAALTRALCALLCVAQPLLAAPAIDAQRAAAVKAAYLVNFLRYTDWPGRVGPAPFTVTVVGADAVADALEADALDPDVVAEGGLVVNRVRYPQPGPDGALGSEQRANFAELLRGSHLVFVGRDDVSRAPDILELVRKEPVLTVSDVEGFTDAGGMLELVLSGRNIVFDVNPGAIQSGGLLVSAKVMKLARGLRGARR